MQLPRSSGILVHPTSFPSRYGIGDLGETAYQFIDFLAAADQSMWQILPFGPTGYGDSPYQCLSAFAGNPLLVSPEKLVEVGLLDQADLENVPNFPVDKVDFGAVIPFKEALLYKAYENFKKSRDSNLREEYLAFTQKERSWLDVYSLFRALKQACQGVSWHEWPAPFRSRDQKALKQASDEHHDVIEQHKFWQFLFFKQWLELREYCRKKEIKIISDLPIFVAYDSADVWWSPEMFKLRDNVEPRVVAGVPPDYFSATGQLWGNPIYDWDYQRKDKFQWWVDRVGKLLEMSDYVRVDHFRGFVGCYEIPYPAKTAENGRFVEVPGREIFSRLKEEFGELPIIAEDLGLITPDVVALRDEFGFPGMRVLQMAFRDHINHDLPHNHVQNCVVYTATHDHDTTYGWFSTQVGASFTTQDESEINHDRDFCKAYLGTDGKEIHWDFIKAAYASVGNGAIVPLQDVFGRGSDARMNRPAVADGNWAWRYRTEDLTPSLSERLKQLSELYARSKASPAYKSRHGY